MSAREDGGVTATSSLDPSNTDEPTRSSRDREAMRARLEQWLSTKTDDASGVSVGPVSAPGGSGMSSETLLFDASWTEDGVGRDASLVARIEPDADDVPVFPTYDLDKQFAVMQCASLHSSVPVPNVRWLELDPSVIGAPFFVMDRVDGRVPSDIPPYCMEGWMVDATPAERRELQDGSVGVLAALHEIDAATHDLGFLEYESGGETPMTRHLSHLRGYYEWVREDREHHVIEQAFSWLEDNRPTEGPAVLSWGDSRIGNIMYDGFTPVAVLDWEMAAVAPAELDVGWMIFMHRFFQDICEVLELPGLPGFMESDDVVATYEALSGRTLSDMGWYETYAATRHGVIMTRVTARSVHFGEAEWPEDVDAVIPHRNRLSEMIGE